MLIRAAFTADAEELAALHLRVWDQTYTGLLDAALLAARAAEPAGERAARWRDRLGTPTWVAVEESSIVGFAQAAPGRDQDHPGLELMSLYTLDAVHGTGVGRNLLTAAVGDSPAYLWVFEGNDRAVRFYRKHGFVFDGTRRQDRYGAEARMVR